MKHRQSSPQGNLVRLSLLPAMALMVFIGACAGSRSTPEAGPGAPPVPGYENLQEQLHGRDLTPFQQRRIVLDPGHGGHFRGALGPNGLPEAEVNLGVALNLRGLLEWAGAEVWLTRTADTDFLSPADSSLASDLAMRVSLSDSLQPDVFLSIHHNSTASLDPTINETQTYYPLDDDGASLDLARSIHRHLVVSLGIQPASIRPGNFHVLRNATVPAVLGEPAMISHPVMAERLSLAASQRLEAEAYFLGLLDYFSGGLPAWSGAAVDTLFWGAPGDPTTMSWRFLPAGVPDSTPSSTPAAMPGPDPGRIRLTFDGNLVTPRLSPDAHTVTWDLPGDLAPVPHTLELQGRNLADRATPRRRTILLPRDATTLQVHLTREQDSGRTGLHWHGANNAPLPTGTLRLESGQEFAVGPDQPDWVLLENAAATADGPVTFSLSAGNTEATACAVTVTQLAAGRQLRLVTRDGRPFAPRTGWRGRLGAGGASALVTVDADQQLWLEGSGVQPLIDPRPGDAATPRTVAGNDSHWETTTLLAGLTGKVIVLDPAGGGTITDGAGPLGLRGADLNLAVAQHAAQLLRGAGARVHLTRQDEAALLPVEKVRLAGRVAADLFLTIGRHEDHEVRVVRYHPGSIVGRRWAAAAARASTLLPAAGPGAPDSCRTEESAGYLLRHTACPALEWRLDPPLTPAREFRQVQPGWHRAEARVVLLAIAAVSGHPYVFDHLLDPARILADLENLGGLPASEIDWALLDGNFPWSPLPALVPVAGSGHSVTSVSGPGLPGLLPRHVLELHAGERWQVWLLNRSADNDKAVWQPTLLLGTGSQLP